MLKSSKVVYSTLLTSSIALALMGCQPTTNTSEEITTEEHEHEHEHIEDAHQHEEHEHEHTEDAHGHEEHEHEEHEHEAHDEHAHEGHEHGHDHAGHDHDSHRIKFDCEPEFTVGAFYHEDSQPKTAHLLIDGIEYDLTETVEHTFVSKLGLSDNHGMVWQVSGDDATLAEIPATDAETATLSQQNILYKCHKQAQ